MPTLTLPDGTGIVYDEVGTGSPALVMVHGYTGGRWYYEKDLEAFSSSRRCIALDLAGHGDSDKPTDRVYSVEQFARDIDDFTRILGLDRFVLFGHSMGGMIAQTYALDNNSHARCVGLVLISTAASMMLRDELSAAMNRELSLYEKGEWKPNLEVQRAIARSVWEPDYANTHSDEVDRAFNESQRIPDIIRIKLLLSMAEEFDLSERIADINLPTLVCVGSEDMLRKGAEIIADTIPNARFRLFDKVGHMINIEIPEPIQKEIASFLNEEFPR